MVTIYQTFGFGLAAIGVVITLIIFIGAAASETSEWLKRPSKQEVEAYLEAKRAWVDSGGVGPEPPYMPKSLMHDFWQRVAWENLSKAAADIEYARMVANREPWPMPAKPRLDDTLTYPSEEDTQELPKLDS